MKIGFIGAGKMGAGMARNLLRAGHEVAVYNRTRAKAEALRADGAHVANSPADAAHDAEAVFTILSDDHAVSQTVFGDNGLAFGLKPHATHIASSTISVALSRHLAHEHHKLGQNYVAANVFGRPEAAEKKQLIIVAGGDSRILEHLDPLFTAIGRRTFIAGEEPWFANAMKLCGNFMIASMMETFGEAFATLRKSGIEHHRFLEVMNELFGSPVYRNYGQIIADQRFKPAGFTVKLGLKDVRTVLETAQEVNVPMPFASVLRDRLLSSMAHGQEELDWGSLAMTTAREAGLPIKDYDTARAG